MKRLIINADGFGFTKGINKGIIESIQNGVVTSTSCNVNFPYIEEVENLKQFGERFSIGIHLNVNVGKPVLPIKDICSLVNIDGEFWGPEFTSRFLTGKIRLSEIKKELSAQIRKLESFGVNISHMDGHQNKHLFPGYFKIVLALGSEFGIKRIRCHRRYLFLNEAANRSSHLFKYYLQHPQRIASHTYSRIQMWKAVRKGYHMADRLITPAYADNSFKHSLSTWINIVENLPVGTNEIYCHPGYVDEELKKYAKYVQEREDEIKVMTSSELKEKIEKAGVQLISFHEV